MKNCAGNPDYEPTEQELEVARRYVERQRTSRPPARFEVEQSGSKDVRLSSAYPDQVCNAVLLADTFGTCCHTFASGLLDQIANVARVGKDLKASELNYMLATVRGINPRDETEALLAAQMAAVHNATMVAARRLNHVETIPQQDSASNMLNKLVRTFAAQVEALKRYRSAGEQTIKVQHVNVNEGGQAIIGDVQHGGGGTRKNEGQSHGPSIAPAPSPALLGDLEANRAAVPSPGRPRQESVPLPRGAGRSPERQG